MIIRIGNAVICREEVLFAWIAEDGSIKVHFKDQNLFRVDTKDPEGDLNKIIAVEPLPLLDA